ncbi:MULTISPECIES: rRNA maturation RNase YbeY [Arthrobacter]|uniref:Endoribonuclease YbeY n=1 Tax=Arthrobacter psychrochitiniphilus TaxID=291045 RepID=A0A2V3DT03_9MICC|nr:MULTISPECIES: rRNA maturation RNase YbeY [Arthrobacter]NYG17659.1 putative rRNA maturation factor [Arthrobacter psychrochitiniphilus]PXA65274.1 rRNA maturation RNase YbeY [Arthrobacter psychrochitiniphilus]
MSIEINNESGVEAPQEELVKLIRHILTAMHLHPQTEVSVILADIETMEKLHVEWMDEPGPTDVLSFPMDELRPGTAAEPTAPGLLGDIVLCPVVAQEQAVSAGHSMEEELLLLTTHGMLHLMGYDHREPEEKEEMFGIQRELLSSFLGREAPRETTQ